MVYLDFSKAFDKVDHLLLLQKLRKLGVSGKLFDWMRSWLLGRRQCVRVGNSKSSWTEVISGVPQGSVLGPLMFLIFIGDLGEDMPDTTRSTVLKYVDDTKLLAMSSSPEDVEVLQEELEVLYNWQKTKVWSKSGAKRRDTSVHSRDDRHHYPGGGTK